LVKVTLRERQIEAQIGNMLHQADCIVCDGTLEAHSIIPEFDDWMHAPLRVIHNEPPLQQSASYKEWSKKSNQEIIDSLTPGKGENPLTTYRDGGIAQGNTRITILQERGVDVNGLPRVLRIPEPIPEPFDPIP